MSFYPTVDETGADDLKALDGWLVDTLRRAYIKRYQLLRDLDLVVSEIDENSIIDGSWFNYKHRTFKNLETQLPSFYKAWCYVRKVSTIHNLDRFPSPVYGYS